MEKGRKIGLLVILILFIVSIFSINSVLADEGIFNLTNAEIKSKTETTIVNNFLFENEVITSDITFYKVGDYVTYELTVKNVSDKDYTISSITDNNKNKNIVYEYDKNEGTKVKGNESITLLVKELYKKGESDSDKRNKNLSVTLTIHYVDDTGKEGESDVYVNPSTNDQIILYAGILITSLSIISVVLISKKKLNKKVVTFLMILSLVLPIGVNAASSLFNITFTTKLMLNDKVVVTVDIDGEKAKKVIDYNTKLSLEDPEKDGYMFNGWKTSDGKDFDLNTPIKEDIILKADFIERVATLDIGKEVNVKMKYLANGTYDYMYYEDDYYIKHIEMANTLPEDYEIDEYVTISSADSMEPIYIWWDEDAETMYWYTKAKKIVLNPDSSHLLYSFDNLTDAKILEKVDTSKVESLTYGLSYTHLTSLDNISSWDLSSATDLSYLFAYSSSITDYSGIANWNMSNVVTISHMFENNSSLVTTETFKLWDTSNIEDMSYLFSDCSNLKAMSGIKDWDMSKVTTIAGLFQHNYSLEDYALAANFDISNIKDISDLFTGCWKIDSLTFVSEWNTSNVEKMNDTFGGLPNITTLDGLQNWNTDKLEDMSTLVASCTSLEDISAISGWNTSNVKNMSNVFAECNKIENLDDLAGWNTSKVETLYHIFANCSSLKDISAINNWDTRNVTNIAYLFYGSRKITGTITLRGNITNYNNAFTNAATDNESNVRVNYTSNLSSIISNIIATKSYASKVYRGSLVSN